MRIAPFFVKTNEFMEKNLDKKDGGVIGFIVGIFSGAIFIGFVILTHCQDWLEKFSSYINVLSTIFIGLLAAAIAYAGNNISKANSGRDEYRFNWEKLSAWREMYSWMGLENNDSNEVFYDLLKNIGRLSSYLALSEDPIQPIPNPKGSLICFTPVDFSDVLQKIENRYSDVRKKAFFLESNISSLTETTSTYFKPEGNWNDLLSQAIKINGLVIDLQSDIDECRKFRAGLSISKKNAEENNDNAYAIVIEHIRKSGVDFNFEKAICLKEKIQIIFDGYLEFENKLNKFYRSYNPASRLG